MIIVHAADFPAPYGGNFIASLAALFRECEARGWKHVLALPAAAKGAAWTRTLEAEGQALSFLDEGRGARGWAAKLCRLGRGEEAVLIHTHFTGYDIAGWMARVMLRASGKEASLVWHAHSDLGEDQSPGRKVKDFLKYRVMGTGAFGIASSDHVRSQLAEAGFAANRLRTVTNGIDASRLRIRTRERSEIFGELGLREGSPLILLFGWDPRIKGVDTAITAVESLMEDGVDATLGLVGTDALRSHVVERAGDRTPEAVQLLPPTESIGDYYGAATLFLSASRLEGLPYSVCEAMSCGLPVVLSEIPAHSFARASSGALFFPVGDAAALTNVLRDVLAWSPERRATAGEANRRLMEQEYDIASWAHRMIAVYDDVMSVP